MAMKKIVLNKGFGGFSISSQCAEYMAARGHGEARRLLDEVDRGNIFGQPRRFYGYLNGEDGQTEVAIRQEPLLIEAVEVLGDGANGAAASLVIVEYPEDADVYIHDYDGVESLHECFGTDYKEVTPLSHFRPHPDDRLANAMKVAVEALEKISYEDCFFDSQEASEQALAEIKRIAGGE